MTQMNVNGEQYNSITLVKLRKLKNDQIILTNRLKQYEQEMKNKNKNAKDLAERLKDNFPTQKRAEQSSKILEIRSNYLKKKKKNYEKEEKELNKLKKGIEKTQQMLLKQEKNMKTKEKRVEELGKQKNTQIPNRLNNYNYKDEYLQFYRNHNKSKKSNTGAALWRGVKSKSLFGGMSEPMNVRHKLQNKISKTKQQLNRIRTM